MEELPGFVAFHALGTQVNDGVITQLCTDDLLHSFQAIWLKEFLNAGLI